MKSAAQTYPSATRIVIYWLVMGAVYGVVTVYLGWGYGLGVVAGILAQPLWNWRNGAR